MVGCFHQADCQGDLSSTLFFCGRNHLMTGQDSVRRDWNQAELLLASGIRLNASQNYDQLLDDILEQAETFLSFDVAAILLIEDDEARVVRLRISKQKPSLAWIADKASHLVFDLQRTQNLREIVETGKPLIIPNVDDYPGWLHIGKEVYVQSWLGVPLQVQDQLDGLLTFDHAQPDFFSREQADALATFAGQAALALRNARIVEESQRQIEELSALYAIAKIGAEAITVDELLTQCTEIVAGRLYADSFGFVLVNGDGTMSVHHAFHNRLPVRYPHSMPVSTGVVGQVIQTGQLRCLADVRVDETYEGFAAHTHSELCVPLRVGDQIIGAINAESILLDAFTEADERFLLTLSQQLSTAIERIQLLEAERQQRQEADTLRATATSLIALLDLKQALTNILNRLEEVVPFKSATVMLLQDGELVIASARSYADVSGLVGRVFPADDFLFNEVWRSKRPLCLKDAQENPHFQNWGAPYPIRGWICVPLIFQERMLGVLTVDSDQVGVYGAVETRLAQAFAHQAAIAIENARLYEAEQQARKTAELMREANLMLAQTLDLDTILTTLLEYMNMLVPYDSASVLFIQGDFAYVHLSRGAELWTDPEKLSEQAINIRTNQIFQEVMQTRQGLLITDVSQDDRWESFEITRYIRSWMGVPIIAGGQLLGCFSIDKAEPNFFTEEHLRLLMDFTNQAAVLVQNAQLFSETRQRAAELETITTLSATLRETVELDHLLRIILENVLQLVNGTFGGIYLVDSESGNLILRVTMPLMPKMIGLKQSVEDGGAGYVAQTGRVYIVPDLQADSLFNLTPQEETLLRRLRTGINLPLQVQDRVVGVLYVSLDYAHVFSDREIQLLTAVAEIAGTAIDRAIVLDTLEQRVMARTRDLAEANERLLELDRLKTKFVSDISHELRTPITNLSLYLDLFEQGKPERREQYTAVLRLQVKRLITMIEDILNISRLDMGKIELHTLLLNMNEIIIRVTENRQEQMGTAVALTMELDGDLPFMLGDRQRIIQILDQILNNAISYTAEGSIHIRSWRDDVQRRIYVEVRDTGIGIPAEELPLIFDRFYRASNVGQSTMPGTGLGLSLVKELVDLHHGHIEITSDLGAGTTVTLYFSSAPQFSNLLA